MNITVCVKPVPDSSIIAVDARTGCIDDNDLVYIINPCDMVAVEEAIRIKKRDGVSHVTALSITHPRNKRLLRRCLAIGADEARLLWDSSFNNLDSYATGVLLAGAIGSLPYDLILCGQKALDTEAGQVGSVIAERLGMPLVSRVAGIDVSPCGKKVMVESKLEKGNRVRVEVVLPTVLTVEADLNEPRYASLPSLMAGLSAAIREYNLNELGPHPEQAGSKEPRTKTVSMSPPKRRPKRVFTPDASLSASERLHLIMSGGVTQKQSDVLEGAPESIASTVVSFFNEKKLLSG
jgi:electron transfer flavoprotein beta subunit